MAEMFLFSLSGVDFPEIFETGRHIEGCSFQEINDWIQPLQRYHDSFGHSGGPHTRPQLRSRSLFITLSTNTAGTATTYQSNQGPLWYQKHRHHGFEGLFLMGTPSA